jgi:hypothetical protein
MRLRAARSGGTSASSTKQPAISFDLIRLDCASLLRTTIVAWHLAGDRIGFASGTQYCRSMWPSYYTALASLLLLLLAQVVAQSNAPIVLARTVSLSGSLAVGVFPMPTRECLISCSRRCLFRRCSASREWSALLVRAPEEQQQWRHYQQGPVLSGDCMCSVIVIMYSGAGSWVEDD